MITFNCSNLTLNDHLTGLSTRQCLALVDNSHLSIKVVNSVLSSVKSSRLRVIIKKFSDVFGDINFEVEEERKGYHKNEISGKQLFCKPNQWTPGR